MSLVIGDNFSFQGAKPLDGRLKYDTLANMKAVADATMYDGCMAYCVATDKTYQWKSTNTVDADTGKWREFSSGGGGGIDENAYHTDDNTFTAIADGDFVPMYDISASGARKSTWSNIKSKLKTYFDTLYFKLTDAMPRADMSEIIDPLPNVLPRTYEYSTKEREVGKWLNGETIYEKVVYEIVEKGTSSTVYADTIDSNMKHIIYCQHFAWYQYTDTSTNRAGIAPVPLKASNGDTFASVTQYGSFVKQATTNSKLRWTYKNDHTSGTVEFYTIIRYTKTT